MLSEICAPLLPFDLMQLFGVTYGTSITQRFRYYPYPKILQVRVYRLLADGLIPSICFHLLFGELNMKTIQVDTLKVMYEVPRQEINFEGWEHKMTEKIQADGEIRFTEFYIRDYLSLNSTVIQLKFVPVDKYHRGENFLFIEVSVPKLLYGCNHRMIEDWDMALDRVNIELSKIPGLPTLADIRSAILFRLDVCVNLQVGDNGSITSKHFKKLIIPIDVYCHTLRMESYSVRNPVFRFVYMSSMKIRIVVMKRQKEYSASKLACVRRIR